MQANKYIGSNWGPLGHFYQSDRHVYTILAAVIGSVSHVMDQSNLPSNIIFFSQAEFPTFQSYPIGDLPLVCILNQG